MVFVLRNYFGIPLGPKLQNRFRREMQKVFFN